MLSINENELPTTDFVHGWIICQQADKLARMSVMEDLVLEQQQECWRAPREEDAVCVMEAEEVVQAADTRAAWKATKKAKQKAWELDSEESSPRRKKAQAQANDAGALAVPMEEASEGMELPKAPCKQCVSWLT